MAAERFLAAILALTAGGLVIPAAGAARAEGQPVVIRVDPARKGLATDAVVRTVPEALARAAALRSRSSATAAIVVELAAGIHRIDRAIRIGADAGGRPGAPLILRGAKDGIARLSGSIPLARVNYPPPAAAAPEIRDRILAYRLPRAAAAVRSIEVQRIHSKPAPPGGLELFDDAGALVPARWPNEGWAKVERRGGSPTRPGIAIEPGRAEHWRSERDLWIAGYFGEDWSFETLPVATVPGAGTLALAADPLYRLRDGARFYVSHAAAELDAPGEWWRDREAGVVHVILRGSRDIEASLARHLLEIDGASDVRVENLTFERSRGDAIRVSGGTEVVVEGCTVRWVGGRGVVFERSLRSGVRRSIISDTGEGGITLAGGDRETLAPSGLFAEDTIIRRFSRLGRTYKFAVEVEGVGARVAGNFIADAPHTAIRFQGNDHEIVLNEIANVATETSDAGAIYTGRDIAAQGTVVRHNFIHDIAPASGFEVKGIYLDDMASGTTIEGNLFLRVQQPVFIGGGRDNIVRGNLFALSSPAVHIDGRGTSWPGPRIDDPSNEVQIALRHVPTASPIWRARYPRLAALMEDDPAAAKRNTVADNALIASTLLRIEPDADLRRQAIGDNRTLDGFALGAMPVEAAAREARRASAFAPLQRRLESATLRAMPLDRMDRAAILAEMLGIEDHRGPEAAFQARRPVGEKP